MGNSNGNIVKMTKSGITNRRMPADTAEIRDTAISTAVAFQTEILFNELPPVDIHDVDEIRHRAKQYFFQCQQTASVPTFIQLCSVLGKHPQDVYLYMKRHPNHATTVFLKQIQTATAGITLGLSQKKQLDPATSIFCLKNSAVGMKDNPEEIMIEEKKSSTEQQRKAEEYKEILGYSS